MQWWNKIVQKIKNNINLVNSSFSTDNNLNTKYVFAHSRESWILCGSAKSHFADYRSKQTQFTHIVWWLSEGVERLLYLEIWR